ncbi:MAG: hypothetical protein A2268_05815 [Candidatus Raymondbacteria bacterium RifOxyA12_full_50_37]|uniref:Uncharacterized protein n=1 Tax=Candidatus Raymondbacteria bacterium RIFOXYD12_FULL_49_13 TaxID=1817890 RepID=A0A1F7FG39_UNCRA|nr:MAG: hypothetical protein A2268_05815 [Candidatus Raymondbacteria bacterium RifOxyA12_full_50_37]OGJ94258.1 MAG: hypothetical protein A2248_14745 [Candidatus Raymondbacteria bacterium RIFOXYA2_FULL_49_16]OGJ94777.1 MAG: hypothetical protein A2487_01930 [Candidatus Raymondbacteria bacterium RifOxyC12_full_50_8]OGJ99088.1 MAG: hypothetical protein A2453_11155 [Candidatus Raymondbacteria bacterium RIFOXYC2_FULL_50_21]OGK01186.1 MAG: hypothetical protein A2350_01635 [Candidatus Raymondbacteria b
MPNLKYCRPIAVCVLIAGLLLAGWGASMSAFSDFAKNRYEHSTGKFLRSVSRKDQTYYRSLAIVSAAGKAMSSIGLLVILTGICCMVRPALITRFINPNKDIHV